MIGMSNLKTFQPLGNQSVASRKSVNITAARGGEHKPVLS